MAPVRVRIKNAVEGIKPLHDSLQFVFRIARLLFAQWPLTIYHNLCAAISPRPGVREEKRAVPVIVSLTSYGKRVRGSVPCVETLLRQTVKPDRIILWLAHEDYEAGVPEELHRLESRGLEIKRCDDWRAYKKIVPTFMENPDAVIVTADDDVFYPRQWLGKLLDAYEAEKELIHCHRSHLVGFGEDGTLAPYLEWKNGNRGAGVASYRVFPTGVGGVLYPPGALDARITDHEAFMEICQWNDDIWLKAMSLLTRTRCKQTPDYPEKYFEVPNSQTVSLWHTNVEGGANDEQLQRVFERFELFDCLKEEPDPELIRGES